ncbi:MAG: DUF4405 domain-containing protein [Ignavibacteriae bacterium]|nr:DUF4405 domain-containing protein [Ignavibacteriota bacterium]NOG97977.1 DUF4405 domain-containing protein [Ignavibacteriota bacterium]
MKKLQSQTSLSILLFIIFLVVPNKNIFAQNEDCMDCHYDNTLTMFKGEKEISLFLNEEVFLMSTHADMLCIDCHEGFDPYEEPHMEGENISYVNCGTCHEDAYDEHKESIHGISMELGSDEAAKCWDCHGAHGIQYVSEASSLVHPKNLAVTCAKCHDNPEIVQKYGLSASKPGMSYSNSVHGKLVMEGDTDAASCVDCHGVHDIKNKMQPGSRISTFNVPEMCGECHQDASENYMESIHWIRAKKGAKFSPVCNDCHSEHSIQQVSTESNKIDQNILQEKICVSCHQDPKLIQKYDLSEEQTIQYQDSYHGLAVMRGSTKAARCIDCHNDHKILPSSHPESSVSEENVTATCQKCHARATPVFSKSYSHISANEASRKVESFVSSLYFWLIISVIGGMAIHNLIIFVAEIKRKRKKGANVISIPRFTKNEVIQHILLFTSFIILAITGFALRYPQSWWSAGLLDLGMTETVRMNIHRVAAVVMMTLGLYHIIYLLVTERGRDVLKNLLPTFYDIKNVSENMLYYLGFSKTKPEFDKYDYIEKAEYWALIWGTLIMGITGLFLWFPTLVGEWAPTWLIKVSEIIHFYEAILASLAIVVWHWFFVIFHPKEYPMSFTWIDGKMSLETYRHHHERHFKRVLKEWTEFDAGNLDEKKVSYTTKLFAKTLKENGVEAKDVFANELSKDAKLRAWFEENVKQN